MVTKADVRDFVLDKVRSQIKQAEVDMHAILEAEAYPQMKEILTEDLKDLSELGRKIHSMYEEALLEKLQGYDFNEWSIRHHMRYVGDATYGLAEVCERKILGKFNSLVLDLSIHYDFKNDNLNSLVESIRKHKEFQELNTKVKALEFLRTELETIIDVSRDGRQAYQNLSRVGVDLSELQVSSTRNLPAVITLRGDVSLINA